jgi:hypothetical protein
MRSLVPLLLVVSISLLAPPFALGGTGLCLKPITLPDRWDDVTGIPGYTGDERRTPDWRSNAQWDQEAFTDQNGNGLYDTGEEYVDGNGNGRHDQEAYHPLHTGYGSDAVEIVLHPSGVSQPPGLGGYFAVELTSQHKPGADAYREAWLGCGTSGGHGPVTALGGTLIGPTDQALQNLIEQDPDAYWDSATSTIRNSRYPICPRIFLLPLFDPRVAISNPANQVPVVKVVAFFAERMTGPAEVQGVLMELPFADAALELNSSSYGKLESPVPVTPETWGRVKAAYR